MKLTMDKILFLLGGMLIVMPLLVPTQMAITGRTLFSDGFESGDLINWDEVIPSGGTITVVTSPVFQGGSYAVEMSTTSASSMPYITARHGDQPILHFRLYINFQSFGFANLEFIHVGKEDVRKLIGLRLVSDAGNMKWAVYYHEFDGIYTTVISEQQINPSPNTWYSVEGRLTTPTGEFRMWVDGVELTDVALTNVNFGFIPNAIVPSLYYAVGTIWMDEFVVSDEYIGLEELVEANIGLINDGFESRDTSAWTSEQLGEPGKTSAGTLSVVPEASHTGTYGLKSIVGQSESAEVLLAVGDETVGQDAVSVNLWVNYVTTPTSWSLTRCALIRAGVNHIASLSLQPRAVTTNANWVLAYWTFDDDGQWAPFILVEGPVFSFVENTWYNVELRASIDATSAEVSLLADGVVQASASGFKNDDFGGITKVTVGGKNSYPGVQTVYVDDVVIMGNKAYTPLPPPKHNLLVNALKAEGGVLAVSYTFDSIPGVTGTTYLIDEGDYTITMPSTVDVGEFTYTFGSWEDANTNPERPIELYSDLTLTATYEYVSPPPLGKGYLEVHAFYTCIDTCLNVTEEVDALGLIVETGEDFSTTTSGATVELSPSTYTVQVTYGDDTLTKTTTVVEGETARVDFNFFAPPPQSPPPPMDYRLIIQFGGVGLVAIGIYCRRKRR